MSPNDKGSIMLHQHFNSLLQKIKLEFRNGEELLNGLLNLHMMTNPNGFNIYIGHVPFDSIIINRNLDLSKLFNNKVFLNNISKFIHINHTVREIKQMLGRGRSAMQGFYRGWPGGMNANSLYGAYAGDILNSRGEPVTVTLQENIGCPVPLVSMCKLMRKNGAATSGAVTKFFYGLTHELKIKQLLVNSVGEANPGFLSVMEISVTAKDPDRDGDDNPFFPTIKVEGELTKSKPSVVLLITCMSGKQSNLFDFYIAGLLGELDFKTPLSVAGRTIQDIILANILKAYMKEFNTALLHKSSLTMFN